MLRPIFITCGTPFCQAARAQSSVTLYGFLGDGIVCTNHSSPASYVVGRKIFKMASVSEFRWCLSGRGDLGGGAQAPFQRENGLSSNGRVFGEGNSFGKFAVGNRPKWERINLGLDCTLSICTGLYAFPAWQKATGDATQAAIFNSGRPSGRRTAANSAPRLKCAHDSSHRLPLNQRSAEVIDPNNSLGVFGAWDIET